MSFSKDFGVPEYRVGYIWNSKAGNLATLDKDTWVTLNGDIRIHSVESRGWYLDGISIPEWKEGAKSAVILLATVNGASARLSFAGEASRAIWSQLINFVGACDKEKVSPGLWSITFDRMERKANKQSWYVPFIKWTQASE